jgi:4-hydroxythreonine-4-phosphate dehydrogenase
MEKQKIKVGITQGDINGIGYEVIIKTLCENQILDICTPVIYGSPKVAAFHRKLLDIQSFNVNVIANASEIHSKRINIINCSDDEIKVEIAQPSEAAGEAAFASLEAAVKDLKDGAIDVLVTAPINRKSIDSEKFNFPGHTEYLEQVFGSKGDALMLMVNQTMRIAILTGHAALAKVPSLITEELIIKKATALSKILLQDFGIRKPRIAVLGLNPHAGENGLLGNEEKDIIIPALKKLDEKGIICVGPLAADSFFGSGHFTRFDGVLAMYHDQGMTPFKAISMNMGINYTASLPVIRTAPIHGTEYEIAGQNIASEESFRQALYLACDIYHSRKQYDEMSSNPLKKQDVDRNERADRVV